VRERERSFWRMELMSASEKEKGIILVNGSGIDECEGKKGKKT